MSLDRSVLEYTPLEIASALKQAEADGYINADDEAIVDRLMDHLSIIKDFNDRLDAVDYLSDNAAKLAGNPKYETNDATLLRDIKALGGSGREVDFELFKSAVDIVAEGYKQMALVQLTGVSNGGH